MAVTILRYPGGLEYPEFWKSNVQGLTPAGSYTLSFNQALSKFPGLEYDAQFNALKNSPSTPTTSTNTQSVPSSYMDIQVAGPATSTPQFNDDQFYQYEQDLDAYNKDWEAYQEKSKELLKTVEDKRAIYLGDLKDPAEIRAALNELQSAINAHTDFSVARMRSGGSKPTPPSGYKPTGRPLPLPPQPISPGAQKNLEIVQQQAATGDVDSKQFLDSYVASAEPVIAQNQGPSTPVKYDEQMKQFVPNPGAGRPGDVRLKNPPSPLVQGPRGEYMRQIASILPPAMTLQELQQGIRSRGQAGPGTKEYGELRDLQKEWIQRQKLKGAEAPGFGPRGENLSEVARNQGPSTPVKYDENMNMFVPNQGGGRPANIRLKNTPVREAQAPAFDEQKALLAKQKSEEYRRSGQVEDPFRSTAFG